MKKRHEEELRAEREARGGLKIENRRMRIKKGQPKYRSMNNRGRERDGGHLHLHLHLQLHAPQQASPSEPGHHGTFPVTGGGSRPHIAVNQSNCCNLRNPHFSCRLVMHPDAMCEAGLLRNRVPHAAHTSVGSRDFKYLSVSQIIEGFGSRQVWRTGRDTF